VAPKRQVPQRASALPHGRQAGRAGRPPQIRRYLQDYVGIDPLRAGRGDMPGDDEEETEAERRTGNVVLVVAAVLLIGGGIWLVNALVDARKLQQCFESGRRNCVPIEVPERGRD
jgi:hypothetical protein